MTNDLEQKIIELQKKLAFQEAAIQELTATVTEQYKRFETLERELKLLKEKLESGDLVKKQEDEERPPHY
jgi:SlyX protein